MKNVKFVTWWILVSSILICIIAITHNLFAIGIYEHLMVGDPNLVEAANDIMREKATGFVYFFVMSGTALLFAGLLSLYSLRGLKRSDKWAWIIALSSSLFVAIANGGAIPIFGGNPLIVAIFLCGLSNVVILLLSGNSQKKVIVT